MRVMTRRPNNSEGKDGELVAVKGTPVKLYIKISGKWYQIVLSG